MNQEIEIKFRVESEEMLIALEDYARQMFPYASLKQVHQTNYFFDTPDLFVRKQGIGVRLRKEDARYFLTLKGPNAAKKKSAATTVTQRLEFEAEINESLAIALLSGESDPIFVTEHLENLDPRMKNTRDHLLALIKKLCETRVLSLIGSFTNLRKILPVTLEGRSMKLEFDRTQFNTSAMQFEVELEIPGMDMFRAAENFLVDLFLKCGQLPAYEKSKSERFYSSLKQTL